MVTEPTGTRLLGLVDRDVSLVGNGLVRQRSTQITARRGLPGLQPLVEQLSILLVLVKVSTVASRR
jgi:hypothetical protein